MVQCRAFVHKVFLLIICFDRSHPVVFNNTISNMFRRNTTDTYNLLKYKRQQVSFPVEPSSGQFDSLRFHTLTLSLPE
jgi:hypothetical protein